MKYWWETVIVLLAVHQMEGEPDFDQISPPFFFF